MTTISVIITANELASFRAAYGDLSVQSLQAAVKRDLIQYLQLQVRKVLEERASSAARAAVSDIVIT